MGDVGDDFRAMREAKKAARAKRKREGTDWLKQLGVAFQSRNLGNHLIVEGPGELVDYWPATGRWIGRKSRRNGHGEASLLDHLVLMQ